MVFRLYFTVPFALCFDLFEMFNVAGVLICIWNKITFHWHTYMSVLCQETFRTTKLLHLLWESLNAFAESPETLATRQKLSRNSEILKEVTKKLSVMVKGRKSAFVWGGTRWFDEQLRWFVQEEFRSWWILT